MSNNIEGKVVVITGASSGLGEATARLLSAQGARVVLGARRVERIQALANELTNSGGKALAVATDVTDRDQVKALVDAAVQTYGRIDVLINNAGPMPPSRARARRGTRIRWVRSSSSRRAAAGCSAKVARSRRFIRETWSGSIRARSTGTAPRRTQP